MRFRVFSLPCSLPCSSGARVMRSAVKPTTSAHADIAIKPISAARLTTRSDAPSIREGVLPAEFVGTRGAAAEPLGRA